jgi:hypothetical protein
MTVFSWAISHARLEQISNILVIVSASPCYVSPCLHGLVHPWVADGGERLQIWRVAANIWNKQL